MCAVYEGIWLELREVSSPALYRYASASLWMRDHLLDYNGCGQAQLQLCRSTIMI
jgi:hypothetical protein